MMTREQVLAEMEASFATMDEETKTTALFEDGGKTWTPTLLLAEVRNDTEMGQRYVKSWSNNKENRNALESLLGALLGGDGMTCGDPDCPNCHGEVRPFTDEENDRLLGR